MRSQTKREARPVRRLLALALLTASISASSALEASQLRRQTEQRPNIIWISVDTLRADHLGLYGYGRATSPSIDRFQADAVLFRNVVSHASSTLPSHASIFTSLLPYHHGAVTNSQSVPSEALTITEVLKGAGYRTLAVIGGAKLQPEFGLDQGFDVYLTQRGPFSRTTAVALELVREDSTGPFFLFLHTYEVHYPYRPAQKVKFSEESYEGPLPDSISADLIQQIRAGEVELEEADLRHIMNAYDGEIRSMDEAFGTLIQELKALGLYDDALFVFTADHGEEFGEHGGVGHGRSLYRELLKVPLLIKFPESGFAGLRVTDLVRSMDIGPTTLAAVGLDVPSGFLGRSLLRLISRAHEGGTTGTSLPAVSQRLSDEGLASSMQLDGWKYYDGKLFNLENDPGELEDVAAQHPEEVARLKQMLVTVLKQRRPLKTGQAELSTETLEQLRSLGYIR